MGRSRVPVPDAGLDPREVVAGLARVKEAGWDLYEKSLHLSEYGGPQRAAMKDAITTAAVALREVRGALQTEMAMLTPEQEGAGIDQDLRVIIQAELRGNPALVRQMLAMLPRDELKQLIEAQAEEVPGGR